MLELLYRKSMRHMDYAVQQDTGVVVRANHGIIYADIAGCRYIVGCAGWTCVVEMILRLKMKVVGSEMRFCTRLVNYQGL